MLRAKVLDFGLAKLAAERMPSGSGDNVETVTQPITRAGAVLGTMYYMAPEQVEAKETDERSDIFSFGVVLYEMISARCRGRQGCRVEVNTSPGTPTETG